MQEQEISLSPSWEIEAGFQSPESVIYDHKRQCIYVSNGIGYAKNGKGFISKVSKEGKIHTLEWISGLNRPTGMAIFDDHLYVVDIDVLLQIDLDQARVLQSFPANASEPGLNDIVISPKGEIYITASNLHAVFQLEGGNLNMVYQHDSLLQYANGISMQGDHLWVCGWSIANINTITSQITPILKPASLSDFDGLVHTSNQGLICSQIGETGKLWFVDKDGQESLLYTSDNYLADFDRAPIDNSDFLIVAMGDHHSKKYGLISLELESH